MNINRYAAISCAFLMASSLAQAEVTSGGQGRECAELVRQCYSMSDLDQSNCFYRASHDAACEGSDLGRVVEKRWKLSSPMPNGTDSAPGLLGPQLIDAERLGRCDSQLLAGITHQDSLTDLVDRVESCLDGCIKNTPLEMLHP